MPNDPHRPQYHFLPPANWMNDPNGLIQWKGEYHLFYQYNPNGPFWKMIHWGHAVSRDLVHWKHLPVALAPDAPYDKDGVYSGCAVDHDGVPTILYTGTKPQVQCLATSRDGLITWEKHPSNPVISAPPPGFAPNSFRDPCVWREADGWRMALGAADERGNPAVLLFRSGDLVRWEYLHPLLSGELEELNPPAALTGTRMWECPGFFALGPFDNAQGRPEGTRMGGGQHVLIVSCARREGLLPALRVAYLVGRYAGGRFTPERIRELDLGSDYYAPATMQDDCGRRLMWGWIGCGRSVQAQRAAGWAGVMSLPTVLFLQPDGLLGMEPAVELRALRGRHCGLAAIDIAGELEAPPGGDALEIEAIIRVAGAQQVGLKVRASPGGEEKTLIYFDRERKMLLLDREKGSLDPAAHRGVCGGPFELAAGEPLRLRVFVDRSVIEVYANGRARLTSRVFPSRPDSTGVRLFSHGAPARLESLDIWEMGNIW